MRYAVGRWAEGRWDRESAERTFSIAIRSGTTTAAADELLCNLWNPSSSRSLWVLEYQCHLSGVIAALDPWRFCRTTTIGTNPGGVATPDLDNDWEREITPQTGAVLYISNWTTEPVLALPELVRYATPTTSSNHGCTWLFGEEGIRVPPGTGLGVSTTGAVAAPQVEQSFRFRE